MEFVAIIAVTTLIKKVIDFVRYLRGGDVNGVVTQLTAWAAGIGVAALAAHSALTSGIEIGGTTLGALDGGSLVFAGISLASAASLVGVDLVKAIDNSDSAKMPPLVPPTKP